MKKRRTQSKNLHFIWNLERLNLEKNKLIILKWSLKISTKLMWLIGKFRFCSSNDRYIFSWPIEIAYKQSYTHFSRILYTKKKKTYFTFWSASKCEKLTYSHTQTSWNAWKLNIVRAEHLKKIHHTIRFIYTQINPTRKAHILSRKQTQLNK